MSTIIREHAVLLTGDGMGYLISHEGTRIPVDNTGVSPLDSENKFRIN
jgi:hypothetical protein